MHMGLSNGTLKKCQHSAAICKHLCSYSWNMKSPTFERPHSTSVQWWVSGLHNFDQKQIAKFLMWTSALNASWQNLLKAKKNREGEASFYHHLRDQKEIIGHKEVASHWTLHTMLSKNPGGEKSSHESWILIKLIWAISCLWVKGKLGGLQVGRNSLFTEFLTVLYVNLKLPKISYWKLALAVFATMR